MCLSSLLQPLLRLEEEEEEERGMKMKPCQCREGHSLLGDHHNNPPSHRDSLLCLHSQLLDHNREDKERDKVCVCVFTCVCVYMCMYVVC